MKLPIDHIMVGGHRYSLVYNPELTDAWGCLYQDDKEIHISPSTMDANKFRETVQHELIHAALHIAGASFQMTEQQEEAVVRCLESLLLPALDELEEMLKPKRKRKTTTTPRKKK